MGRVSSPSDSVSDVEDAAGVCPQIFPGHQRVSPLLFCSLLMGTRGGGHPFAFVQEEEGEARAVYKEAREYCS